VRRFASVLLVAAASVALIAQTDQVSRKPGLWETRSTGAAGASITARMCIDAATDAALLKSAMGQGSKGCSKNDVKSDGKQITADSVCTAGDTQITVHSSTTLTSDTVAHTVVTVHYDPPLMGQTDTTMTQDGKWTGPCPADMRPGDIIGAGGTKTNVKDLLGR
jgi:hypothetical protein